MKASFTPVHRARVSSENDNFIMVEAEFEQNVTFLFLGRWDALGVVCGRRKVRTGAKFKSAYSRRAPTRLQLQRAPEPRHTTGNSREFRDTRSTSLVLFCAVDYDVR